MCQYTNLQQMPYIPYSKQLDGGNKESEADLSPAPALNVSEIIA